MLLEPLEKLPHYCSLLPVVLPDALSLSVFLPLVFLPLITVHVSLEFPHLY
jgi:hypothetical protein